MSLWWLSFVDPDRPEGAQFLGVSIVELDNDEGDLRSRMAAVIQQSWRTGCNPGGEVSAHELPIDNLTSDLRTLLAQVPHHVLLDRADLEEWNLVRPA